MGTPVLSKPEQWSAGMRARFCQAWEDGVPCAQMAARFGIRETSVWRVAVRYGLKRRLNRKSSWRQA